MNNQAFSKIWIVIIVIVFLAGGILAWQYFGMPREEVKAPKEKVENEIAERKTYKNEEYEFEVKYPSDWKVVLQDEQLARIYTDDHIISEEECKKKEADLIQRGVAFGPTGCRFGIFISSLTKQEVENQYSVLSQYQSSLSNSYQVFQLNRDYLPPDFAIGVPFNTNQGQFIVFEAYNIRVGTQAVDAEVFLNQMLSTFKFLE